MVDKEEIENSFIVGTITAKNIGTTQIDINVCEIAYELEKNGFTKEEIYKALENLENENYIATFYPPSEYDYNSHTTLEIKDLDYVFSWKNMR